jgi:hypothetical protein
LAIFDCRFETSSRHHHKNPCILSLSASICVICGYQLASW